MQQLIEGQKSGVVTIEVHVGWADIKSARPNDINNNPVAKCLRKVMPNATVSGYRWQPFGDPAISIEAPREVADFIFAFYDAFGKNCMADYSKLPEPKTFYFVLSQEEYDEACKSTAWMRA